MKNISLKFKKQIWFLTQQIKEEYRPQKIILYGSAAKNKATRDSDIDIFIIKNTHKRLINRINDVLNLVDSNIPIEPIVYTPIEVKARLKLGDPFITDIVNEGIVLYEKRK
ncbi:MAG: nucleotidyltransferase domain-containing protein [Candidatus Omnitrophota bacterium]